MAMRARMRRRKLSGDVTCTEGPKPSTRISTSVSSPGGYQSFATAVPVAGSKLVSLRKQESLL